MALAKTFMTPEEYLKFERASEEKHEYFAGEIFDFPRSNQNHVLIMGNTAAAFHSQLSSRPCDAFMSRMRIKIRPTGLYTYPDICIVCGESELEDLYDDTLLNPIVIIEILSPATEAYDRGKKFQQYRLIETLRDYLLIAQDNVRIEHFSLRDGEWIFSDANTLDGSITLPSIDCTLSLSDVYEKITFDKPEGLH